MATKNLPNATRAEILDEIEIPGIDMIHGVSFDGTNVWFAGGPDSDLFCVDPRTKKVVRRLGRSDCAAGTAWDGAHLWQICGDRIHKLDASGKTLHSIPTPSKHSSGMAWGAGALWCGSFDDRKIHKVDPQTGAVLKSISSDRLVTGVTWAGSELWHGTYPEHEDDVEPGELRHIDAETGEVRRRLHLPSGSRISGIESDGKDKIWLGSRAEKSTLRAVKKPSR